MAEEASGDGCRSQKAESESELISLGIDLSLTRTGLAVHDGERITYACHIKTTPDRADEERYVLIGNQVIRLIEEYDVEQVGLEAPAFSGREKRPAELTGHVRVELWRIDMPYCRVAPNTLKKYATGYGRASKEDMVEYARDLYPEVANHDEADAIHLAKYVSEHGV